MRARRRVVRLAAALVVHAVVLLPASRAPARAPAEPRVVTVATTGTVDSLSPFLAQRVLPTSTHRLIYDFLTNYSAADSTPIGGMATSWTTSPDKLTWTFTIRSGMTWSDGRPATARDIAWTYRLLMTNADAATANGNFVANFREVTAPDEATLVIRLATPQATMLALDIPIVPEHVWRAREAEIGTFHNDTALPVVSNGPFVLTGYRRDQYVELSANERYWRGRPKFDKVVFRMYRDLDGAVTALRKGEVDFVSGLTGAQFDALAGERGITRNKAQGKGFYALNINPGATTTDGRRFGDGHPALRDRRVRQAILHAIDTQVIVRKVLDGHAEVGSGYLPPIFPANDWTPDPATTYGHDPARANQLLDDAGYRRGADGVRRAADGRPLTLRLAGMTRRAADAPNATYVSEWLAAVGVRVTTSVVEEGALADLVASGNYDLVFDSWLTNPDPDYVLYIQTCRTRPTAPGQPFPGANFMCDAEYDALYARQLAEYDRTARSELIKAMQRRLYQDAYVNVLYYPNVLEAYRGDAIASMLKQPQPNGMYSNQDGYWSWWSAVPATSRPVSKGPPVAVLLGVAVAVAAVVLVVVVVLRRRATAGDRE
ncbi:ABC transporter substrate-binding protein [Virgisporangium aurantiacum]|uniref:ABC transporter substrate-binding protein n=1 Tax=Virgisporangium aurantiacum TaxID=175570 RepID=A0A8J3Z8Z1_9ACTN|nr:ABC transporter substrate-binding protein [Virgisporangium aurantiacum]GIJ57125.1 ABC transporter substrate-binding protein [Virgisporangium aurantiacum]